MKAPTLHRAALITGWLLLSSFSICVAWLGGIATNVRVFQLAYLLAFAGYALLLWVNRRSPAARSTGSAGWWLAGAIALRIPMLAAQPSDDVYRYLWEGRVQLAGFNPYAVPPDGEALVELRDDDWSHINHPDYPAIYGPVAQMLFAAAAALHPSVYTVKLILVLADVMTVLVLAGYCRRRGLAPGNVAVYALCPLVLCAFAVEGHLDSLMLLLLVLAAWAVQRKSTWLTGVMVGLAMSVKIVCIILLPYLLWRHRRAACIAVATLALTCLPYLGAGFDLLESLVRFSRGQEFFSLFGAVGMTIGETDVFRGAAAVTLLVTLTVLARRRREMAAYAGPAFGAMIVLMPVVHYWYVCTILMWASIVDRHEEKLRLPLPWLAFSLAMVVYFEVELRRAETGVWAMPTWAPTIAWSALLFTWLACTLLSRWRGPRQSTAATGDSRY